MYLATCCRLDHARQSRRRKLTKNLKDHHIPRYSPALRERLAFAARFHPLTKRSKADANANSGGGSGGGNGGNGGAGAGATGADQEYDSSDPEMEEDEVMFSPLLAERLKEEQVCLSDTAAE